MKLWNSNSEIKIEENKKGIEKTLKHVVVEEYHHSIRFWEKNRLPDDEAWSENPERNTKNEPVLKWIE
jgi:hypothetical protein